MDFSRILAYSAALTANNNRPWFHENHKTYEAAKSDFYELLELMRFAVGDSAPELWDELMHLSVKDWSYRIARDMRYCHDLPPYNPAFRAYISRDKKSWLPLGYYVSISPGQSCFGTGLWCEDTATTNRIRDYIMENYRRFDRVLAESGLVLSGNKLKNSPRGYPADHPAAELIKFKQWMIQIDIPDEELTDFDLFCGYIRRQVTRIEPVRHFMLEAAGAAQSQKQIMEEFYGKEV